MEHGDYEAVYSLMSDERFVALRRRFDRELVLWPDFADALLPDGYTREQVWNLLVAVRRQTAIELPWGSFVEKENPGPVWYTRTQALTDALASVETRTRDDSALGRAIEAHRGTDVLDSWLREDMAAALEMDGAPTGAAGLADPRLNALASNFRRLAADTASYATRPLSPEVIETLHHRLCQGAGGLGLNPAVEATRIDPHSRFTDPAYTLDVVCQIANGHDGGARLSPTLRSIYISWLFLNLRPLPSWNGLVEILVRHICLIRQGFAALAAVPLARLNLDWIQGRCASHRSFSDFMAEVEHYRNDYTPFFLIFLELISDSVGKLSATMGQLALRDAELEERLRDAHLNHRQRAIILNAANDPGAPQKIERHRVSHRVAYATARKDFLDLVELGYLRQDVQGRALVFYAGNRLLSELGLGQAGMGGPGEKGSGDASTK